LADPHRHALANERVRFVGELVALIVADTEWQAQDAIEKIVVEYRELPVVTDAVAALAPNASKVHEGLPGNLAMEYEFGNAEATQAAFDTAAHVVRVSLNAQRLS